jgi:plastocyanin
MKKLLLFFLSGMLVSAGFCATTTVSNSGTSFTPQDITIALGDNVSFTLGITHDAVEVSQATWNANGNTPLSSGFAVPFGGGNVFTDKLTVGIHYYVCEPHAAFGMKGTITVLDPTGIAANPLKENISVYPNPSNGNFQLQLNNLPSGTKLDMGIYTLKGQKVFAQPVIRQQNTVNIETADLPKGVYILRLNGMKENYCRKIVIE